MALTYVYPFAFMLATAVKPKAEYIDDPVGWPTEFTLSHLRYAWNVANLGQAMINSLVAVGIGVVVCVCVCSAAAFWFIRNTSRVSKVLLGFFGSLWMVPQVVWIIPFFIILSTLHLTNNLIVLGIVYGSVFAPTFIWLLWAYFLQGIPREVLEAAEVDGCSLWQQYWRIVLPLSRPALGAVAALCFVFAWGDLLMAVVLLQDSSKYTVVPAAAGLIGRFDAGVQETTAAAAITIAPSLVVFLIAQRAIVRGITGGVGK
jgi:ABC-type glycerol-3-phosphate transport system permease component